MKDRLITVRAPEGKTCPWPGRKGNEIGVKPVPVRDSYLVRRLISDGSLEVVPVEAGQAKKNQVKKGGEQ